MSTTPVVVALGTAVAIAAVPVVALLAELAVVELLVRLRALFEKGGLTK